MTMRKASYAVPRSSKTLRPASNRSFATRRRSALRLAARRMSSSIQRGVLRSRRRAAGLPPTHSSTQSSGSPMSAPMRSANAATQRVRCPHTRRSSITSSPSRTSSPTLAMTALSPSSPSRPDQPCVRRAPGAPSSSFGASPHARESPRCEGTLSASLGWPGIRALTPHRARPQPTSSQAAVTASPSCGLSSRVGPWESSEDMLAVCRESLSTPQVASWAPPLSTHRGGCGTWRRAQSCCCRRGIHAHSTPLLFTRTVRWSLLRGLMPSSACGICAPANQCRWCRGTLSKSSRSISHPTAPCSPVGLTTTRSGCGTFASGRAPTSSLRTRRSSPMCASSRTTAASSSLLRMTTR
mmetsp:Transcript_24378/g.56675  ORF Transcript_24378/g.56675 Transcript_24378/m.56675 type:complete len:354 (+) Transcript_24378:399-1460(+)